MRPLVKFLFRVKPTTTTPVSTVGGSGLHHHHHSSITIAAVSRATIAFYRFGVSLATLVLMLGLKIIGRVTRGRRLVLPALRALTLKLVASPRERSTFRARRADESLESHPVPPSYSTIDTCYSIPK